MNLRKWLVEAALIAVAVLIGVGVACAVREWSRHQPAGLSSPLAEE